MREAQAIAALNHPYICIIHDIGEHEGVDYLVMEYLDGRTLGERISEGALASEEARKIAIEIAEALTQAHQRGIVHRDVKPGNIMLATNGTKLLDFGLARATHGGDFTSSEFETATGLVLGTPAYMSPEQLLGLTIDARSDVFSFGVVFYEMVTGARPFRGANVIDTIDAILHKHPEPISEQTHVPQDLQRVIYRCLEKARDERYQSCEEVLSALCTSHSHSNAGSRRRLEWNLPFQLTSFVGRTVEVKQVRKLLSEVRLLTLVGSGGCGKTRLSFEIAKEVRGEFTDGVFLVELGAVSSRELVPQAVAAVLDIQADGRQPLTERLTDFLENRTTLLILDNCEHVVGDCAALCHALLASCDGLKILATSREPLNIEGETIWHVPVLSFPDEAHESLSVPNAEAFEAIRLFVERARAVAAFELTEQNLPAVAEICRRLDGIPLALEMAAARTNVLLADELAERLRDRFVLLGAHSASSPPRQQTLRRTVDWSHSLLSPIEKSLFQRLAVFVGSFTLEAVEVVCSDQDLPRENILNALSRLVEKSMVATHRERRMRYRLLETLREYALERLRHDPLEQIIRHRHAEFFANLAEQIEPGFYTSDASRCSERLAPEHLNCLAALEWCGSADGNPAVGLRLAGVLLPFWDVRGYMTVAVKILHHLLEKDLTGVPTPVRAKALGAAGYLAKLVSGPEAARPLHEESLRLSTEANDQQGIASQLWRLGDLARLRGDNAGAQNLVVQSLEIARQHGTTIDLFGSLNILGMLAFDRGEYDLSQSYWAESLEICRDQKFGYGLTQSLFSNARLALARSEFKKAETLYVEGLTVARGLRNERHQGFALISLGQLYSDNDFSRSRTFFEEGLAIFHDLGLKHGLAQTSNFLADLSVTTGHYEEARNHINESLALYRQLGEDKSPAAVEGLRVLAELAFATGEYDQSLAYCELGLEQVGSMTRLESVLVRQIGWIHLAKGEANAARTAFERSGATWNDQGAEPHLCAGSLEMLEDKPSSASSYFREALNGYERRNNRVGMVNAQLSLGDASVAQAQLQSAGDQFAQGLRLAKELGFKKGIARALRSLGTVGTQQGAAEDAARFYGAADAILTSIGGILPPFHSIGYEGAVGKLKAAMGEDAFDRVMFQCSADPTITPPARRS